MPRKRIARNGRKALCLAALSGFVSGLVRVVVSWLIDQSHF